jgi:hypothetical protein
MSMMTSHPSAVSENDNNGGDDDGGGGKLSVGFDSHRVNDGAIMQYKTWSIVFYQAL